MKSAWKLVLVITVLAATFSLDAQSQQKGKSLAQQLVGTWTFVSANDTDKDGKKLDRWGANPKGSLMFDSRGRYSFMISRSDIPKFAAKSVNDGTAEENKAVVKGMIAHFGTYTVNEAEKALITKIEGASFPNIVGGDQKRMITSLTADELKYTNPASTTGATSQVVWKRVK